MAVVQVIQPVDREGCGYNLDINVLRMRLVAVSNAAPIDNIRRVRILFTALDKSALPRLCRSEKKYVVCGDIWESA